MSARSGERSVEPSPRSDPWSEGSAARGSGLGRVKQAQPRVLALVGAAVGVLTGVLVERRRRSAGNEISGDVAVHLLNRIELLTIRVQVRQARSGGPAEIDVHHVQADTSSRP